MKNEKDKNKIEVMNFLIMCNEADRKFFYSVQEDRKVDDYVRLMSIVRILNYKFVLRRLIFDALEYKKINKLLMKMEEVKNDNSIVIKWMDQFVEQIELPVYKEALSELWEEKKERIKNG